MVMTKEESLKNLYEKYGKKYLKNSFIFKEGEESKEFFIILSGRVEIFKEKNKRKIILEELGSNSFFGEMAIIENMPRSASAKAVEDTKVIILNKDVFFDILQKYPKFTIKILISMSSRLRKTTEKLFELTKEETFLSKEITSDKKEENFEQDKEIKEKTFEQVIQPSIEIEDKSKKNKNFWKKEVKCPICKNNFEATNLHASAYEVEKRDTDFCITYKGTNPLIYSIWVCPNCLYADERGSFEKVTSISIEKIKQKYSPDRKKYKGEKFIGFRDFESGILSYELAIECCKIRNAPKETIAGFSLRCAWLYRYLGNKEKEKEYLKIALENYILSFEKDNLQKSKLGEIGVLYLIGELSRRLGDYEEAVKWFSKTINHPDIKAKIEIERLARDGWMNSKEFIADKKS